MTCRQRMDVQLGITNATASSLLGLTLGCAVPQSQVRSDHPATTTGFRLFRQGRLLNLHLADPQLWKEYEATNPKPPKPQTYGFFSPSRTMSSRDAENHFVLPYQPELKSPTRILVRRHSQNGASGFPPGPVRPSPRAKRPRPPRTALADWLTSEKISSPASTSIASGTTISAAESWPRPAILDSRARHPRIHSFSIISPANFFGTNQRSKSTS